jgi:hypothetical protein
MKNTANNSSCSLPSGRRKLAVWLGLIAVTTTVGTLLGNLSSGLIFGLLLGLPLIAGG